MLHTCNINDDCFPVCVVVNTDSYKYELPGEVV